MARSSSERSLPLRAVAWRGVCAPLCVRIPVQEANLNAYIPFFRFAILQTLPKRKGVLVCLEERSSGIFSSRSYEKIPMNIISSLSVGKIMLSGPFLLHLAGGFASSTTLESLRFRQALLRAPHPPLLLVNFTVSKLLFRQPELNFV